MKFLILTAFFISLSTSAQGKEFRKGEILLKIKNPSVSNMVKILSSHQASVKEKIVNIDVHIISVPIGTEEKVRLALAKNPNVEFVELNMMIKPVEFIPNDTNYLNGWHLPKINMPNAWEIASGSGVVIAILDTGIKADHPDLEGNILPGWNIINNDADSSDIHGHGTSVAGAIAAVTNNDFGVAAVAYNSSILPVRISNRTDGYASLSDIAKGINYASDNGVDIINNSYRSYTSSTIKSAAKAFHDKGGLIFISAGNNGIEEKCSIDANIMVISATDKYDNLASWSSYGDCVDLSSPGVDIYTTNVSGGHSNVSGTSFASPIAAAVAALVMSYKPGLSNNDVESIMLQAADKTKSGLFNIKYGYGRVDAFAALNLASSFIPEIPEEDTQLPSVSITAPLNNSKLKDIVNGHASATDNIAVTNVEFYLDGVLFASDDTAPYDFSINTLDYSNGEHSLMARAFDSASNSKLSTVFTIVFENNLNPDTEKPLVNFTSPSDEAVLNKTIQIQANASDNRAVTKMELFIDDIQKATSDIDHISYSWNTKRASSGEHVIKVQAFDAAGNFHSEIITLNIAANSGTRGNKGKGKK